MRVKVGDGVYSGEIEPVMVILTPADRANLVAIHPDATSYCSYPDTTEPNLVKAWMREIPADEELQ